jgi:uncharacterized membrane protein (DUF485 family)
MEASGRSLRLLRPGAVASLDASLDASIDDGPSLGQLAKRRSPLVVPLFALSFSLFLSTLLILSYCPAVVSLQVVGSVNVAYLLAMLQFVATFSIAIVYASIAKRVIDPLVAQTLTKIQQRARR